MILKKIESDTNPSSVQTVIEHIQPKQCCLHEHEGCTPSAEYLAHQQLSQEKTNFWKKKLEELQNQI